MEEDERTIKRFKGSSKDKHKAAVNRQLFAPFRALGIITNGVAPVIQTRSSKDLSKPVVTAISCTGNSWAMWDISGAMRLLFVGPETPSPITALAVDNDNVYATAGSILYQYARGKVVASFDVASVSSPNATSTSSTTASITLSAITLFGAYACVLESTGKTLYIFSLSKKDGPSLHSTIEFAAHFTATNVLHPATYLNKVLVSSKEGHLQLWNIATHTLIHTFEAGSTLPLHYSGAITCVVQSPAIDVVAVGYATGSIALFDIRVGELLLHLTTTTSNPTQKNPITALSFRTDNVAQTLASSDAEGNLAFWDLDKGGVLASVTRKAHERSIHGLVFIPGQPVLVSAGSDNAIRQWLFDTPTSPPRLLKSRAGHHSPPSHLRFYGSDGKTLLTASAGDRSIRYTSLVRDSRSTELSQGNVTATLNKLGKESIQLTDLKAPPIVRMAFPELGQGGSGTGSGSIARKEWDDLVTIHKDEIIARTWSVQDKRIGKRKLVPKQAVGRATACVVSACGNFGLVGYEKADYVEMWNLQSGIKRRTFMLPPQLSTSSKRGRHVSGLETDSLNTTLVAGTLVGDLHFFDFHTSKHISTTRLPAGIEYTMLQRDNNLLACVCEDLTVRMVDIETRRIVREFSGFKGRIVDLAFSQDSHWLVCTSTDSLIRTFDIPTGTLVDVFRTKSVATSIAFSPTGEFLATGHVDGVGVYLWTNRAQFADVQMRSIDEDEVLALQGREGLLPALAADEADVEGLTALDEFAVDALGTYPSFSDSVDAQLAGDLVTLSLLPRSKWTTLLNLETIQARNKPVEPPKKPENAPFFLPTLGGTELRFDLGQEKKDEASDHKRRLGFGGLNVESALMKALREQAESGAENYHLAFFSALFALTASALDLEIRSLSTEAQLALFMRAMALQLYSRRDFEAAQAVLKVFLSVHADALVETDTVDDDESIDLDGAAANEVQEALRELLSAQLDETKAVSGLVRTSLGMLAWTRGVPVV